MNRVGRGVTTWRSNAKGKRREDARGERRILRAFAPLALCVKRPVHGNAITVELSEDLANWRAAASPASAGASVELEIPTPAGAAYAFYRVVLRLRHPRTDRAR